MPKLNKVATSVRPSATISAANVTTDHQDPINLAVGEPGELPASVILDAAAQALHSGQVRYGASAGSAQLRIAIAKRLSVQSGLRWDMENIIVTAGGKPALMDAMRCTLAPNDEVLILAPYWPSFVQQIEWCGAKPVYCQPDGDLMPDLEEIRQRCTAKTKAIVINSPSNPTSVVYSKTLLKKLAEIAEDFDLWVYSDQVYVELGFGGVVPTLLSVAPEIRDRVVVIESFSKSFSMTGMRLGYAGANLDLITSMITLAEASTTHPNVPAQVAGLAALNMGDSWLCEQRARYQRRSQIVVDKFAEIEHTSTIQPEAGFYVFANIERWLHRHGGISDLEFAQKCLSKSGVRLVPGSAFGCPGYVRISCGLDDERLTEAMARIALLMA